MINKIKKKLKNRLLRKLNTYEITILTNNLNKEIFKFHIDILSQYEDKEINKITNNLKNVLEQKDVSIFNIFEVLKIYKYYLYSKLITENNYTELKKVFNNKLYNKKYEGDEIPSIYSNKIIDPTYDNIIKIFRFESEYTDKFLNFLNIRLLIRGRND